MVAIVPATEVAKPTAELPLRYGLFQAAIGPLDFPDLHMRGGGLWYANAMCEGGQGYEINCIEALDTKVFSDEGMNIVTAIPFVVFSSYECLPTQGIEWAENMARQKFRSVEQAVVESIFSSGAFAQAPSLANNPAVVEPALGGATDLVDIISVLETALYCTSQYGPAGVIHAPITVINRMKAEHLIEFSNGRWRTPMGTVVSAGCYSVLDPDGAEPAAGTFWIYITGQTAVYRTAWGEEEVIPVQGAWNRTTNEYRGVVEREYALTFECAIYAAPVTLWTETP